MNFMKKFWSWFAKEKVEAVQDRPVITPPSFDSDPTPVDLPDQSKPVIKVDLADITGVVKYTKLEIEKMRHDNEMRKIKNNRKKL